MSPHLRVEGLRKRFGHLQAVDDVSFDVDQGELITLLGPSGCGKSTTLRLIAGLERPDAGAVFVHARALVSAAERIWTPPEKRGIGMVFQNYAVWPHMTVFDNVAFPLQAQRVPRGEARQRVMAVLESVGLAAMAEAPAPNLSGGQQQRVALARALVSNPSVLLLDEPFSNLDARLRDEMRLQLRELQRRLSVTSVFVTHDQTEAMMLSDRVLVMNAGHVEQAGTPQEVYETPRSRFVMDFLGQVSHLSGIVHEVAAGGLQVAVPEVGTLALPLAADGLQRGDAVVLAFRSADVRLAFRSADVRLACGGGGDAACGGGVDGWPGVVTSVVYLGGRQEYVVKLGAAEIRSEHADARLPVGTPVGIQVPPGAIRIWPAAP